MINKLLFCLGATILWLALALAFVLPGCKGASNELTQSQQVTQGMTSNEEYRLQQVELTVDRLKDEVPMIAEALSRCNCHGRKR